jgi:N-acetylneuraminate synthase
MNKTIKIDSKVIGKECPTYFVADIAANHDGDINRAKELIYLCAEAGADAAKFQHFHADTIVSDYGFKNLGIQQSHQAQWNKSVFDVYQDASLKLDWTPILKETCDKAGISFLTSPYSLELVDFVDQYISAYKVGSGDITWLEIIEKMSNKGKPLLLATGASNFNDVNRAMKSALTKTKDIILMQCNTNYTASLENFKYINLNVLKSYSEMYPNTILGLSDHTPGHSTVLGAVTLGARVIEKHFTDDVNRDGPDHKFSMSPELWREMVNRTKELEESLGTTIKKIEDNEKETVVLQRRAIRAKRTLYPRDIISKENIEALRPCPADALHPYETSKIIGKKILSKVVAGEHINWENLG